MKHALPEHWWKQPELTEWNRLPGRATLFPFPDESTACSLDPEQSPFVRSLNGSWRFRLLKRPEKTPRKFAHPTYNDGSWDTVQVPGNWTCQGYDQNIYTNFRMPFDEIPPRRSRGESDGPVPHLL